MSLQWLNYAFGKDSWVFRHLAPAVIRNNDVFAGKLGNNVKEFEGRGSVLSPHCIFRHESLRTHFENESQNGHSYKNCILNLYDYSKKQKLNIMEIIDHTNIKLSIWWDIWHDFLDCWMKLFKEKKIRNVEEKNDEG
jgi:hypothetical protein